MRRLSLLAALVACLTACKSQQPGSVDLTIVADASLADMTVAAIRSLEVDVSGAAAGGQSYLLAQAFSSARQERVAVRPPVNSGMLQISVLARSAGGDPLAFGQTQVTLRSSGAVPAEVVLTANLPTGDLGPPPPPDGSANVPEVALFAGQLGGIGSVDGTGAQARFNHPRGAVFVGGSLYVADMYNDVIRRIDAATGAVTTFAGTALKAGSADGIGAQARFDRPHGITTDGQGNLFVTDMRNDTIRQIVIATGAVTTLAGAAGKAGTTDAVGAAARFSRPHGITSDGKGNLFVADTRNQTIRQIVVASGVVTTFAGTAGSGGTTDGAAASARFNGPRALLADGAGNLYVADSDNNRVRQIVISTGLVTTLAGHDYGSNDGTGAGASFAGPMALAADGAGHLFAVDGWDETVRQIALASQAVTTLAGSGPKDGRVDGVGAAASFRRPHGLCTDGNTLYVADKANHEIRKVDFASGQVTTVAGNGAAGAADGVGASAQFNNPFACAADGAGHLYVTDSTNDTIRAIALATGTVTTLAGAAKQAGSTTNVSGAAARFNSPSGIVYAAGTLYVADSGNATVRAIDVASTQVTTLAGTAGAAGSKDGTGAAAQLDNPVGLALEGGVLYVSDQSNQTIRSITLPGAVVGTLAGSPGVRGSTDGPGSTARFDMPQGLVGDGAGDLYVTDTRNHTIRKIVIATTVVSTYAGTAGLGAVQLGPLPATLNTPTGIAFGPGGALVFTTTHENAVLIVR